MEKITKKELFIILTIIIILISIGKNHINKYYITAYYIVIIICIYIIIKTLLKDNNMKNHNIKNDIKNKINKLEINKYQFLIKDIFLINLINDLSIFKKYIKNDFNDLLKQINNFLSLYEILKYDKNNIKKNEKNILVFDLRDNLILILEKYKYLITSIPYHNNNINIYNNIYDLLNKRLNKYYYDIIQHNENKMIELNNYLSSNYDNYFNNIY